MPLAAGGRKQAPAAPRRSVDTATTPVPALVAEDGPIGAPVRVVGAAWVEEVAGAAAASAVGASGEAADSDGSSFRKWSNSLMVGQDNAKRE